MTVPDLEPTASGCESLDQLTVATPCPESWENMRGDDRVRYCGGCRQSVYNLAAMGRAEALRMIERRTGRLCVRLHRRPDGTIVTADCRSRLRAARRRGRIAFAFALVVIGCGQLWAMIVGIQNLRRLWFSDPEGISSGTSSGSDSQNASVLESSRRSRFTIVPPADIATKPRGGQRAGSDKVSRRKTFTATVTVGMIPAKNRRLPR
jgi:hypothetical protein